MMDNANDIKMMEIPTEWGYDNEDITRHKPQYVYGKDMHDYVTNSIYNDWCRWYFPEGIKEKIEDNQLYLVWYHYSDASDPQDSSCQYNVYYIEKAPKEIQEAVEMIKKCENKIKKYQNRYEKQ
jgi:hypothetical protein